MKTKLTASLLFPCAALLLAPFSVYADTVETDAPAFAPKQKPLSDYASLDKKSPFEFDPVKTADVVAEDPFKDISLAGFCGSGNTMTVYLLMSGKEKKRITVFGDGSVYKKRDESGYRVIGLNRGKSLKTTSVTLEKDGVQKEVTFEDDTLIAKGGGGPGHPQQTPMVPGPDGKMVPRPIIPRPGGNVNQPQQQYQAPQAFIPGQSNNPQPQQASQPGVNALAGQNVGNMSNQQLVNHLTGPGGQQPVNPPAVAQPQTGAAPGGGDQQRGPSRRRVVLPTQQ